MVKSKIEYDKKEEVSKWILDNGLTTVLSIIPDYKRYYPLGSTLSNVLGFTGTDNTGLEGLEAAYNDELAGKAGGSSRPRTAGATKCPPIWNMPKSWTPRTATAWC